MRHVLNSEISKTEEMLVITDTGLQPSGWEPLDSSHWTRASIKHELG